MEIDGLDHLDVTGDLARIPAEEQVLVGGEAVHGVARAVAGDALVGLDPDQGGVEVTARHRVPGSQERRVQWQPHPVQADSGDLHSVPGGELAAAGPPGAAWVAA